VTGGTTRLAVSSIKFYGVIVISRIYDVLKYRLKLSLTNRSEGRSLQLSVNHSNSKTDCRQITLSVKVSWATHMPGRSMAYYVTVPINDYLMRMWSCKQNIHPDRNIHLPTNSPTKLLPLSDSTRTTRGTSGSRSGTHECCHLPGSYLGTC
jgi:hypothetical protein